MTRFLSGIGLILVFFLGAMVLEGATLLSLLGLTAFLITFSIPFFGSLAVWSFGEWKNAWSQAFRPSGRDQARTSVELWKFSELASYLAGLLGALAGGILILGNLENFDLVRFGHSFGALLVAPTYGVFFGLVCRILRARVENLSRE